VYIHAQRTVHCALPNECCLSLGYRVARGMEDSSLC
jgi:hypothetical protein